MFGIPMPPVKERLDRLECAAAHIRALGAGAPVNLSQPHYPLHGAESYPLPSHGRLRLVVGGRGEKRTLRIAAEFADEWNVTRVDVATFKQKRQVLAEHCRAFRRDPETITRSLMIPLAIGRDRADVARRIDAARAIVPALPEDEAGWRASSFLAGSPEAVIQSLARVGGGGHGSRDAPDARSGGHRRPRALRAVGPAVAQRRSSEGSFALLPIPPHRNAVARAKPAREVARRAVGDWSGALRASSSQRLVGSAARVVPARLVS